MARQAEIKVEILADPKNFEQGMDRTARATEGIQQKLGTFAKAAVAALAVMAVNAVKDFVNDSVRAFSDLEQATGAVDSVFGDQGARIDSWAKAAAKNLGLAESAAKQASVVLGSMLQNYGFSVEESATKTMELIEIGADLSAMFGGTVEDAVNAIGAALRGETESIEKYGVSMNATKVQSEALAMGLAATTAELTPQHKAMAALKILTDQTAKAQGQFAREEDTVAGAAARAAAAIENNKARIGEIMVPVKELTTDLGLLAAKALGMTALAFQNITGDISNTQYAMEAFQVHTGETADTLQAAVTINKEYGISFEDLFASMKFSEDGLHSLTTENESFLLSIGYTQEEVDTLSRLIDRELVTAQNNARDAARHHKGAQDDLADATEGATEETEEQITALQNYQDVVRAQYDPLFALVQAENDLSDATEAVRLAEEEHTKDSPEYQKALRDQAIAFMDVREAQLAVAEQSGLTRSEFETNLVNMGIFTQEQIDLILADFDRVNAFKFSAKTVTVNVRGTAVEMGFGLPRAAAGGPQEKGQPVIVGEQGEEVFIPYTNGTIIPNNKISRGGTPLSTSGATTVINLTIHAGVGTDPNALGRVLVEALQRYERANGSIPITVRQS